MEEMDKMGKDGFYSHLDDWRDESVIRSHLRSGWRRDLLVGKVSFLASTGLFALALTKSWGLALVGGCFLFVWGWITLRRGRERRNRYARYHLGHHRDVEVLCPYCCTPFDLHEMYEKFSVQSCPWCHRTVNVAEQQKQVDDARSVQEGQ